MKIQEILKQYFGQIDCLDLELIIARALNKPREFVLAHPEFIIAKKCELKIKNYANRRLKNEPLAYIFKEKEFYGLNFKVNKNVLIPRPETEMIIDLVSEKIKHESKEKRNKMFVIDVGTGSGNIIISIASQLKNSEFRIQNLEFFGTDISQKALAIAKQNAKTNKLGNKIKFLKGNLLDPIIKNTRYKISSTEYIVTANLPYLSLKLYNSSPENVRNYEPKIALLSQKEGLNHYEELLKQLSNFISDFRLPIVTLYLEISPEQKIKIKKIIKKYFPKSKIIFHKDLAKKWRICQVKF